MSKKTHAKNKDKSRKSISLKAPFTRKELIRWSKATPKQSKMRLVRVNGNSSEPASYYIEALYWEDNEPAES